jgi:hypothetical protein
MVYTINDEYVDIATLNIVMIKNYVLYYNAKKIEKLLYYYYEISDKKKIM